MGDVFALYGVVAMLAYFPGGAIADYFSARKLMVASLIAMAIGSAYFYTIPTLAGLYFLFAYFGLTSILLFWAAMIKATRNWGGSQSQGMAFGILDGGRGLVASLAASVGVFIFASFLGEELSTYGNQVEAIQSVILYYSILTLLAAVLVWFMVVEPADSITSTPPTMIFKTTLLQSKVWLQGGIIIAAYCGFKALDNYGIYAVQVLGIYYPEMTPSFSS